MAHRSPARRRAVEPSDQPDRLDSPAFDFHEWLVQDLALHPERFGTVQRAGRILYGHRYRIEKQQEAATAIGGTPGPERYVDNIVAFA